MVFILLAWKGMIFALPPGRRKETFTKKQLQGCQGRFIHSFCRSFCTLVEATFSAGILPHPYLVPSAPVPARQRRSLAASSLVRTEASPDGAGSGSQASPSFGSPRLAFPQQFNHSSSPERNVPRHLCLELNCVQEPGFAHTC